ncbi:MAG: phytase [Dokdonella sp.]
MMLRRNAILVCIGALFAVNPALAVVDGSSTVVAARAQTAPSASGEIGTGVLVVDADEGSRSRVVSTTALGGLEIHDLVGVRLGNTPAGEAVSVAVAHDVPVGSGSATVIATIDSQGHRLRLYTMTGDALTEIGARPIDLGFAGEGVCLHTSPLDGSLNAFVVGDGGEIDHQLIYADANGKLDARQVRRIGVPSPLKQCVVAADGKLYASEETVGIWRFNADPEAYAEPTLIDSPRLGKLGEEVGGLAVYDGGDGNRWLIASVASDGQLNVYDRDDDDRYIGSFKVRGAAASGAIGDPGPLFATSRALGGAFPNGALLVADEDDASIKLVSIADLASTIKRAAGSPQDPRKRVAAKMPAVTATVETVAVSSFGDAADDPAIWANPLDPAASVIIATDKKAGLLVYDMQGKRVQFVADGKLNNVDLRDGFELGGEKITLVTASNRTHKSISIYRFDAATRALIDIADGIQPTGLDDPYGLCMYWEPRSRKTFVFINGDETKKRQWQLVDAGNGRVKAKHMRDMRFDSQTEGCVADDASGALYVAEEDVGLWRLSAKPNGGDRKRMIARILDNPALKDDFEGVALYDLGNGRGYLVVSSQGNDSYAVFRREGKQEYLGSFVVSADPVLGIDGISETDGLEVTSNNLGPGFEHGAMVAQDGRNVMPVENQNYKIVPWKAIADALKLEVRKP